MKKMIAVVFACCIPLAAGGAYAQDMKKDEMKKDAMGPGEMKKDMKKSDTKKDAMGKDEMMKDMNKGGMKKDEKGMMKEEMKK